MKMQLTGEMPRDNHVVREIPSEYFCPEHRRLHPLTQLQTIRKPVLQYKMLRVSHLTPIAPPAFSALRVSLTSTLNLSSPFNLRKISTFAPPWSPLSQTFKPNSPFLSVNRVLLRVMGNPCTPKGTGEDLSDLAAEYSICPSKEEGGMLGWVKKGQMVPEFEDTAFSASLNKVVRCKTKFGWHLLQVLSEREESLLQDIQCEELHVKMQDPSFLDEAQLIDVREPEEVAQASLSGFQVLPLRQFGSWGPDITTKFDPQKDTYVMCHHGVRSLQVAKWLQTQGFKRVFNVSGGIHEYAIRIDQTIPTY